MDLKIKIGLTQACKERYQHSGVVLCCVVLYVEGELLLWDRAVKASMGERWGWRGH